MSGRRVPIVVLGGGPAGLAAAWKLARTGTFDVTVLERNPFVGGNAGSFDLDGLSVDYGSHRLHPASLPEILDDVREHLGSDLLDRKRHGRIRLRGRWLRFPLKPIDLLTHLPPDFTLGVVRDAVTRPFSRPAEENFATVLQKSIGGTICRDFYFPYAEKLWGLKPEELDAEQARRRVSANSISKLIAKVLSTMPGLRRPGAGRFFYPRHGYGQIAEGYHRAAVEAGARVELGTAAEAVELEGRRAVAVVARKADRSVRYEAHQILSTIPLPILVRATRPEAPESILAATDALRYRAMLLIYLVLGTDRFSEYDAHYFPSLDVPISRLSEPKNYGLAELPGRTVLCAELPCSTDGEYWSASRDELAGVVARSLETVGLPIEAPILRSEIRRLPQAYPMYERGYERHFATLDDWLSGIEGLITFGRQGLFVHDNTHHTIAMSYRLAECLDQNGDFDRGAWSEHRKFFETFVVED